MRHVRDECDGTDGGSPARGYLAVGSVLRGRHELPGDDGAHVRHPLLHGDPTPERRPEEAAEADRSAQEGRQGAHLERHRYLVSVSTWAIALFANSTFVSSEMRSTARSASMLTTVAKMPLEVSIERKSTR